MCCDGGPKSIGRQKQKLCQLVFGWQSTGYKEVRRKKKRKKKHRVRKMIYKRRLPLNADSQSCLRFACFPQEHQRKNSEMSPDKQTNKKKDDEEEEDDEEQRRP